MNTFNKEIQLIATLYDLDLNNFEEFEWAKELITIQNNTQFNQYEDSIKPYIVFFNRGLNPKVIPPLYKHDSYQFIHAESKECQFKINNFVFCMN